MTAKRYFKRMWEEEYYIFDSNTISESDFEEKLEYQGYKAFEDSMMGDEVVNRLNEQHETIGRLKQNIDELLSVNVEEELLKENEQLKQSNKDAWNLIRFIYNEIKEDGYMDWGRIQDLVEF